MEYEIVNLPEKTAVGISARTNNFSPDMCKVIGNLWKRFFEEGIFFGIKNKANEKALECITITKITKKEIILPQ